MQELELEEAPPPEYAPSSQMVIMSRATASLVAGLETRSLALPHTREASLWVQGAMAYTVRNLSLLLEERVRMTERPFLARIEAEVHEASQLAFGWVQDEVVPADRAEDEAPERGEHGDPDQADTGDPYTSD